LFVPPDTNGWSVANNVLPSPPFASEKPLFRMFAAFTCLVLAIERAKAFVYLADKVS